MTHLFVALFVALAAPQEAGSLMDMGPKVGDVFPAFEAADQHGQMQSLETLRGANGLLLLFYRSADW